MSAFRLPPSALPAALGYRMPAEWEPHAATWISWPHKRESWPGKFEPIPPLYARLISTLSRFEPVRILAGGKSTMAEATSALVGNLTPHELEKSPIKLFDIPTNDAWTRDHGPTFLVGPPGSPPALVDWGYNAWGGKYPPFDLDDAVPRHIAELTGRHRFTPGIILEGGAIDPNGRGTILTTEQCLLNPNRNPRLNCADMERYLADYLARRKSCGLAKVSKETTPTGTSTSWLVSSVRAPWWRLGKRIPTISITDRCVGTLNGSST